MYPEVSAVASGIATAILSFLAGRTMTPDPHSLVELYRARNLPEANALANELEQQGIAFRVENEDLQGSFGTIGWAFSPRVLVTLLDKDRATDILTQFLSVPSAEV